MIFVDLTSTEKSPRRVLITVNLGRFYSRDSSFFKTQKQDLTQPTTTGAIISISSGLFILFLLVSEFLTFMRTDIVSELYVDDPTVGDKIPVNIRMSLPGIGLDICS
jgi:hypothetical protein